MGRSSQLRFVLVALATLAFTAVPVAAQRGGGGNGGGKGGGGSGGGEPTAIHRPVVLAWPSAYCLGSVARYGDPEPAWVSLIDYHYHAQHPDQLREDGSSRALIGAVSEHGDLTHGGGTRYVLDLREAPDGSTALIATVETVGTRENPTWFYDGPGGEDDLVDHVLLTDADFLFHDEGGRARWSRDGSKIAMCATEVSTGRTGIFVGDVVLDAAGHPDGIANLTLVAPDGQEPMWGDGTRIAFYRGWLNPFVDHDGFVVDISVPTAPIEVPLGPIVGWVTLTSDGRTAAYARSTGDRNEIFVRDLTTGLESQVTDSRSVPEDDVRFPCWSPDDSRMIVAIQEPGGIDCQSLAELDLVRGRKRQQITKTFVISTPERSGIYGGLARAIWRR